MLGFLRPTAGHRTVARSALRRCRAPALWHQVALSGTAAARLARCFRAGDPPHVPAVSHGFRPLVRGPRPVHGRKFFAGRFRTAIMGTSGRDLISQDRRGSNMAIPHRCRWFCRVGPTRWSDRRLGPANRRDRMERWLRVGNAQRRGIATSGWPEVGGGIGPLGLV